MSAVAVRLAAALGVLLVVTTTVGVVLGPAWPVDHDVLRWFIDHRTPTWTSLARAVTVLGSSIAALVVAVSVAVVGIVRRRGARPLVFVVVAWAGAELLFQVTKALVGRDRPPTTAALGSFTGLAFPSGHATLAAAVWGALAIVLVAVAPRWRVPVYGFTIVVVALIGVTRLYLGAHWVTDVLAGWALGAAWVVVLCRELPLVVRQPPATTRT